MILVDTSVWIDHFRGNESPQALRLVEEVTSNADICICGLILTEVLQGIRADTEYEQVKLLFEELVYLPVSRAEYALAAEIYRRARKRGKTVRKTLDCIIAACAIAHDAGLLTKDRDFLTIGGVSGFELLAV